MKITIVFSAVLLTLGLISCRDAAQAPQSEQPAISSYEDLPTIPPEAMEMKRQAELRGDTIKAIIAYGELKPATPLEMSKIKANIAQGNGTWSEIPGTNAKTTDARIGTTTQTGCNCPKTMICEFFCGVKLKIIVTGIPNCCHCYQSFYGGGWIDCEGSGCSPRAVPCFYTN